MQDHIGFYPKCERDKTDIIWFDLNKYDSKITLATVTLDSVLEGKIVQKTAKEMNKSGKSHKEWLDRVNSMH